MDLLMAKVNIYMVSAIFYRLAGYLPTITPPGARIDDIAYYVFLSFLSYGESGAETCSIIGADFF